MAIVAASMFTNDLAAQVKTTAFHVSPNGNDHWMGTLDIDQKDGYVLYKMGDPEITEEFKHNTFLRTDPDL